MLHYFVYTNSSQENKRISLCLTRFREEEHDWNNMTYKLKQFKFWSHSKFLSTVFVIYPLFSVPNRWRGIKDDLFKIHTLYSKSYSIGHTNELLTCSYSIYCCENCLEIKMVYWLQRWSSLSNIFRLISYCRLVNVILICIILF